MTENVLKIDGLHKTYGKLTAVNKLSLEIPKGSVFGLLGPNGSGKTTTLGMLLGIIKQDAGSFSWFNNGAKDENRLKIGALLETPNFYPYLSAENNLKVVAEIKGRQHLKRIPEVLKVVNLFDRKDDKFKGFSLGMKQRLAIASALLSDPEVLVLDEPTNGLDPQGIAEIRQLIIDIAKSGKTIIIASHILIEIEKICSHVVILNKGNLIKEGLIDELLNNKPIISLKSDKKEQLISLLMSNNIIFIEDENEIKIESENINPADLNKKCFEHGIILSEIKTTTNSLEEEFIQIINDHV